MKMARLALPFVFVTLSLVLAACGGGQPVRSFSKGAELAAYTFSDAGTFEEGLYPSLASLTIRGGAYRIDVLQGNNALWWGQWGDSYGDVIIDVDADQITEPQENAFGVMCRVRGDVGQPVMLDPTLAAMGAEATQEATEEQLTTENTEITEQATEEAIEQATQEATAEATEEQLTTEITEITEQATEEATEQATQEATAEAAPVNVRNEGDGYLFLIQGNGQYAIMRARGRNLTPLVDWTASDAIQRGVARNAMRVVCVGNYLALYVNGTFLAEATDDTYSEGQVGLAASAANRLGTSIQFDNLIVSAPAAG